MSDQPKRIPETGELYYHGRFFEDEEEYEKYRDAEDDWKTSMQEEE